MLQKLVQIYIFMMILYALASWLPSIRGRWLDYVTMVVEPVLNPVRRVVPPLGGLDMSFLIVIIIMQWISAAIVPSACLYRYASI